MLWNSIIEFYITKVFGGYFHGQSYQTFFTGTGSTNTNLYSVSFDIFGQNISLPNYLAFISTLITIVFIFVICCLFIYKIIKLVGGLIR